MTIEDIEIGTKWKDAWGIQTFDKNEKQIIGPTRIVTILDKTSNSIAYKDIKAFVSWVTYEEFTRIEKAINRIRFSKI